MVLRCWSLETKVFGLLILLRFDVTNFLKIKPGLNHFNSVEKHSFQKQKLDHRERRLSNFRLKKMVP